MAVTAIYICLKTTVPRGSNHYLRLSKNYRTSWQRLPYFVAVIATFMCLKTTVLRGSNRYSRLSKNYRTSWQRLPVYVLNFGKKFW